MAGYPKANLDPPRIDSRYVIPSKEDIHLATFHYLAFDLERRRHSLAHDGKKSYWLTTWP